MKMRIVQFCYFILLFSAILIIPATTLAQDPEDPCPIPFEPCPIDSNVYFLIAAAIIVAAKKTYDFKQKQSII